MTVLLIIVTGNVTDSEIDPLVEILKYAFVLRLSLKRVSEAKELESLINELYTQDTTDAVISILQLLIELKNFQTDTRTALVFILSIWFHNFRILHEANANQIFYLGRILLW